MVNVRNKKRDSEFSGRTLLEVLAFIALMSSVSIGAYSVVSNVYARFKIFKTRTQLRTIVDSIRNYYAADGNYSLLSVASAISDGVLPSETSTGTKIFLSTGAEITNLQQVPTERKAFRVEIQTTTKAECVGLLEILIDQNDRNKAALRVRYATQAGPDIVYSWTGATNCSTGTEWHFSCLSTSRNITDCKTDGSLVSIDYF